MDCSLNDSLHHVSKHLRIVSLCTIVSRVFGLMRDQAMGVIFGAGPVMDAFTVAFRLPNLARVLLGEGALATAFLPVFVAELHERGRESAARATWAVFLCLAAGLSLLVLLAEVALWAIGRFCVLSSEALLLRNLTAILLPYVILICLAAQISAVLNALERFLWPAVLPIVLNIVWLGALWGLVPLWPDERSQIHVIAACVVIGGTMQLLLPLPILSLAGFGFRRDWWLALDRVWKIAGNMLPVVIGLSITQLNSVLDSLIAWGFTQPVGAESVIPWTQTVHYPLKAGTATALYLGQRLYQFPLGVFGVALGTVLFPRLTSHAQRGELDQVRADLSLGVRLVLAIGLPASVGLMLMGHPLATLFFQYGKFDAENARQTGDMIAAYGSGVWAYCGLLILQRGCYAIGDRLTPMYFGLVAMLVNLMLNVILIWPLGGRGLALSTAVVAAMQCAATAGLLQRRIGRLHWHEIGVTAIKTVVATAVMAIVCWLCLSALQHPNIPLGRMVRLVIPCVFSVLAFLLAARSLGLKEPWLLIAGSRLSDDT